MVWRKIALMRYDSEVTSILIFIVALAHYHTGVIMG